MSIKSRLDRLEAVASERGLDREPLELILPVKTDSGYPAGTLEVLTFGASTTTRYVAPDDVDYGQFAPAPRRVEGRP